MKVSDFSREVNLLEIVNRGKATTASGDNSGVKKFINTFSQELAKTQEVNFS